MRYSLQQYFQDRNERTQLIVSDRQQEYLNRWYQPELPAQDDLVGALKRVPSSLPLSDWYDTVIKRKRILTTVVVDPRFLNLLYATITKIDPTLIEPYYGIDKLTAQPLIGRYRQALPLSLLLPHLEWSELLQILSLLLHRLSLLLSQIRFTHNNLIADNILIVGSTPILRGLDWSYFEVNGVSFSGVSYNHHKIVDGCAYNRAHPGNDLYVLLRSIYLMRPYEELGSFLKKHVEDIEKITSLSDRSEHLAFSLGGIRPTVSPTLPPLEEDKEDGYEAGVYNIPPGVAEQLSQELLFRQLEDHRKRGEYEEIVTLISSLN